MTARQATTQLSARLAHIEGVSVASPTTITIMAGSHEQNHFASIRVSAELCEQEWDSEMLEWGGCMMTLC